MPNSCSLPSEPYLKCSTGSAYSTGASVRNRPARYDAPPTTVTTTSTTASTALTCPACRRGSLVMVLWAPISPLRRGGQAAHHLELEAPRRLVVADDLDDACILLVAGEEPVPEQE